MPGAAGSAWRAAGGHCSGCDRVVVPVRPPFSLSPAGLALWAGEVEHLSRDKGITRPSATPWGYWCRAAGVALLLWSVMACSPGGLWDPDGIYWSRYDGWGTQLQQHRDANFAWKDGSGWLDGVSHVPPKLPLASGASVGESLTCAQEETLIMLAFPTDRGTGEMAPAARCGGSQPPVENRVCPDGVGKPCRCPGVVEPGTLCGEMRPRQPLQAVQPFYKLNFTSPWVPLRELSRGPFARRCGSGAGGRTEVEGCLRRIRRPDFGIVRGFYPRARDCAKWDSDVNGLDGTGSYLPSTSRSPARRVPWNSPVSSNRQYSGMPRPT